MNDGNVDLKRVKTFALADIWQLLTIDNLQATWANFMLLYQFPWSFESGISI